MPHDVTMPQLGMAQDTGVIVSWQKKPGDAVKVGDVLMEVETDKATMEVEAVNEGFLAEIRAEAGAEVPVGDVIAVISESADDVRADTSGAAGKTSNGEDKDAATPSVESAEKAGTGKVPEPVAEQPTATKIQSAPQKSTSIAGPGGRILASPKAKWEAHQRGIDLGQLVRRGTPQPFHVADLDNVPAHASTAHAVGTSTLKAEFNATAFDEFVAWADGETSGAAGRCEILAAFAAGALRAAIGDREAEREIAVKFSSPCCGDEDVLLGNPDLHGLTNQSSNATNGEFADIAIVDLFDSSMTGYDAGHGSSHAVLVITGDDDTGTIAFSFSEDDLPLRGAVQFLNDLAGRIAEPLRQLL